MAEQASAAQETVTLGALIHNQQVIDYLTSRGIKKVDCVDAVKENQQLVIRSHGAPPAVYREAQKRNIKIIDATCPYVQKAQRLAEKLSADHQVIVVGDRDHPEVIGILGWAGERALAVETLEEAERLPDYPSIAVLAQTTQDPDRFSLITDELKKHTEHLIVNNTICNATKECRSAACEVARNADIMIVVGGRSSSNTQKLGALCAEITQTHIIETADELQEIWFKNKERAGLTAGASTPDWIIEEVYCKMSEILEHTLDDLTEETTVVRDEAVNNDNNESMMNGFDDTLPQIYRGAIVKGTVVKITDEEVFVDISWKSEGVIPREELAATRVLDINDHVKLGDTLSVMVIRLENQEGYTVLSRRRVAEMEARERLAKLAETKEEVSGKVTEAVKGGLLVDLGMRGFVPASQIELGYVDDLTEYIGKTLRLRVLEYDEHKKKLVLSQKAILVEEKEAKRQKLLEDLKEGDVVKGIVRRLTNFGAFIDLGGIDGLLHVSDMAFSRVNHPSDIVKVDDEVEVQVLSIDKEKARISLGLKQLRGNPWSTVAEKYPLGSLAEGKVVRIAPFGAFVQLEDGVDALVHISQLSDRRVGKVEDVVKVGDQISAKVIECKPEEKRISLSIKEALADSQKEIDAEALAGQQEEAKVTIGDAVGEFKQSEEE